MQPDLRMVESDSEAFEIRSLADAEAKVMVKPEVDKYIVAYETDPLEALPRNQRTE